MGIRLLFRTLIGQVCSKTKCGNSTSCWSRSWSNKSRMKKKKSVIWPTRPGKDARSSSTTQSSAWSTWCKLSHEIHRGWRNFHLLPVPLKCINLRSSGSTWYVLSTSTPIKTVCRKSSRCPNLTCKSWSAFTTKEKWVTCLFSLI
jgi:hypothetical protein